MRMMTTAEAAERLGCEQVTVRKAIRQGRLTAQKFGPLWVVLEDEKFRRFTLGTPGRPPKVMTHDEGVPIATRKQIGRTASTPRRKKDTV